MSSCPRNNHKRPFVNEKCSSVIKISLKEASKPSSNSNSSLCLKRLSHLSLCLKGPSQVKGKRSARQSKPPTKRLIATNVNDESHVRPKRKSTKSASGDGDVPLVKKPRKSKVMNKKERDSLKLQFLLNHQILWSYIADKLKSEKTPSYLKSWSSSLAVCWERISY